MYSEHNGSKINVLLHNVCMFIYNNHPVNYNSKSIILYNAGCIVIIIIVVLLIIRNITRTMYILKPV